MQAVPRHRARVTRVSSLLLLHHRPLQSLLAAADFFAVSARAPFAGGWAGTRRFRGVRGDIGRQFGFELSRSASAQVHGEGGGWHPARPFLVFDPERLRLAVCLETPQYRGG